MSANSITPIPGGLLTVREAAATLGVSDLTVRRWIKAGRIQVIDLAPHGSRGTYRIAAAELRRLIDAGTRGGEAA